MTDLRINIATPNGTGSLTANKLLTKVLLKNHFFCSSKNLFPSNIAGLPTWYNIRISSAQFTGFKKNTDIYIGFNKSTFEKDISELESSTTVITNADFKLSSSLEKTFALPIRELSRPLCKSPSLRKLLSNMIYVGYCAKILGCEKDSSLEVCTKHFQKKSQEMSELNSKAFLTGYEHAEQPLFDLTTSSDMKFLMDGNSAAALGFLDGGATVATWYPITPSSSLVENFEKYNKKAQNPDQVSVLQCEDEITSVVAALGAGWGGARAFTATSGPGLSLMQEALGLGYFAEVPFVIADVQRAGPSTGLPTRTAQGDLLLAHYSSHGDTLHPVLLPSSPQELYDDGYNSLNLAEQLQTPVLLLSDLDLGMNDWAQESPLKRNSQILKGNTITEAQEDFKRYALDESSLPHRSIPFISDSSLSYFTRGSGHDEYGNYSEDPEIYHQKLQKLKHKVYSQHHLFPQDEMSKTDSDVSLIYFGSTAPIIEELKELLGEDVSTYKIRSLPLSKDFYKFASEHKYNFVLEQNRDGQMYKIIKGGSAQESFSSCTQSNGLPADALHFSSRIKSILKNEEAFL